MEGVIIRDMHSFDLKEVHRLECDCDPTPWSIDALRYEIGNEHSIIKVALLKQAIIGYICIRTLLDITHIMKVSVHDAFRRNGTGSLLLSAALKGLSLRKPHIEHVTLEVRETNIAAIGLYVKFGFRKTGFRKDYYKNPVENGLVMQLDV